MVNYLILSSIIWALNYQPLSAKTADNKLAYVIQSIGPDGQIYQYEYESPYQTPTQTEYQEYYSQPYQTRSYYTAPQQPYIQSPVNQTYQTYPYYPAYTYPYYNPGYVDPYTYPARPSYQPSNRGIMHYYFGHD